MDKQQTIREILLKYTLPDALKPEYDGMTAWELAGIILKEVEDKNPELVEIINKMFKDQLQKISNSKSLKLQICSL